MNQIEIIFGVINRRRLRHGSFQSTPDLTEKLPAYTEYFNATFDENEVSSA